ncbi:hypothetical protein VTL71DRAFT_721 [Oculimacula yallundae]|uniref:Uncharacterized protein n=1 Tax=Oculimacula yallundae TaxID=86028 RepID=A0ABR4D0X5_9HELO
MLPIYRSPQNDAPTRSAELYEDIGKLLGQGFGHGDYKKQVRRLGHTWKPGMKDIIMRRDVEFFKEEIQDRRREEDHDPGSTTHSNSLASILKRLQGLPWLQSQLSLNELDGRRKAKRLLGKDVKVRYLQLCVNRWDTAAAHTESSFVNHEAKKTANHTDKTISISYLRYATSQSSTLSYNLQNHYSELSGILNKHLPPNALRSYTLDNTHNHLSSTNLHDPHSLLSNRMSLTLSNPYGVSGPECLVSAPGVNTVVYPDCWEDDLSHDLFESQAQEFRSLTAGWFENDATDCNTDLVPDCVPGINDELVLASSDRFQATWLTPRPIPAYSGHADAHVAEKREQDLSLVAKSVVPMSDSAFTQRRLSQTFGITDTVYRPCTPLQFEHFTEPDRDSDTDMMMYTSDANVDDGEESDGQESNERYENPLESGSFTKVTHREGKSSGGCCGKLQARIQKLGRRNKQLRRAHEAELSAKRSENELMNRRLADQAAQIKELAKIIEKMEISGQKIATMKYDEVTQNRIAKQIVDEEARKSQTPDHNRSFSATSSSRDHKSKALRTFESSKSPLPLRTARDANNESSATNDKLHRTSNDDQAHKGEGGLRSRSSGNRLLQKLGKSTAYKSTDESVSNSLASSQSLPSRSIWHMPDSSAGYKPDPRQQHIALEASLARPSNDSGYGSLRSFGSDIHDPIGR